MSTEHQLHHQQHHQTVAEQPGVRQAIKFTTAATVGVACLALSGLTMTGTVLALVVITPLLVLFSPVLVPAVLAALLAGAGLVFSGGCGAAAIGVVTWVYSYVKGRHPPGADGLDHVRQVVGDTAAELKEKVLEAKERVSEEAKEMTTTMPETGERTVEIKERTKGRKGQPKGQES